MNVIKSYARRDSATALLRKMGISQADYNQFITLVGSEYKVDVTAAEDHLGDDDEALELDPEVDDIVSDIVGGKKTFYQGMAALLKPEPKATKKVAKVVEPKVAKVVEPKATKKVVKVQEPKAVEPTKTAEEMTVSDVARTLILEGKTNEEVWAVIKAQFDLDDSKKSYPSWYRCELKRKGQL